MKEEAVSSLALSLSIALSHRDYSHRKAAAVPFPGLEGGGGVKKIVLLERGRKTFFRLLSLSFISFLSVHFLSTFPLYLSVCLYHLTRFLCQSIYLTFCFRSYFYPFLLSLSFSV